MTQTGGTSVDTHLEPVGYIRRITDGEIVGIIREYKEEKSGCIFVKRVYEMKPS